MESSRLVAFFHKSLQYSSLLESNVSLLESTTVDLPQAYDAEGKVKGQEPRVNIVATLSNAM